MFSSVEWIDRLHKVTNLFLKVSTLNGTKEKRYEIVNFDCLSECPYCLRFLIITA